MKDRIRDIINGWYNSYKNNLILKRFSVVLLVDILARLSSILLLPVYLYLMTQGEYGLYNYILSIVTTFSLIFNFGLYVSQSKYYTDADSKEKKGIVLFNISGLLSALLIVILTIVYLFKWDHRLIALLFKTNINYYSYRAPILLALIVSAYTVLISNYFITSEKVDTFRKFNIVRLIFVNTIVLFSLYFSNKDTVFTRLTYTYLTELIILVLFSFYYIREMVPRINLTIVRNSMKLGLPIMLSAVWGLFANYSDKFFLEKHGTSKDLSHYYLAFSISNILYMVCAAIQNIWLPVFLKEKNIKQNIANTKKLIVKLMLGLAILSILLIAGFYIAIKIKVISFGYWPAIYLLPILLLSQMINGIVLIYSNYMIYFEKTQWVLFIGMFCSIVGFIGGYYIVPIWNTFGAAIVYLSVQIAYVIIYYVVIRLNINKLILSRSYSSNT